MVLHIKQEVLEASRDMVRSGLVTSVWGNVSARVTETNQIIVTPSGMDYLTMRPEDLVTVDLLTGTTLDGQLKPTSELHMHLAIYRARADVGGILHTHSLYASACAVTHREIPPIVEDLVQVVGGSVSVAKYALPGTEELANHVVKTLGKKRAVLLANHGVVGVGPTVTEALRVSQIVEKGARIFSIAKALGNPVLLSHEDVEYLHHEYLHSYGQTN